MKVITLTANPAIDITARVDDWQRGSVNRAQNSNVTIGGKGINVAINLASTDVPVHVTGWLGDANDDIFIRRFTHEKIIDDFIRVPGNTRQNLKIVDWVRDETTDFNLRGLTIEAADQEALNDYLAQTIQPDSIVVLGGSLPLGIDDDYYARCIKTFRDRCHLMVVDASGTAMDKVMASEILPHIIKPNIHELRAVTGKALTTDTQIVEEARQWIAKGLSLMVVSMGGDGAWFINEQQAVKTNPLKIKVASSVGAGDAMVAGTIRGIIDHLPLTEIARLATAYSAANIERIESGLPSQKRLQALFEQVTTEIVAF